MEFKLTKQLDDFGCGIACLASRLGISYQDAIRMFENGDKKAQNLGFTCKELTAALSSLGLMVQYNYLKPKLYKKNLF